jgi:hypothetical protein
MHLGTLMDHLAFEDDAAAALEALGDIVLFSRVQAIGECYGETPGEYVANAARRFAQLGSDEDWLGLMTVMERSADPSRGALERMLRWSLERDAEPATSNHPGCSCGSASHRHHPS